MFAKFLYVFPTICILTHANKTVAKNGSNASLNRVYDGKLAAPYQFPYQVGLVQPGGGLFCGGTIINESFVVTAAHCNLHGMFNTMWIVAGDVDLYSENLQWFPVASFIVHHHFNRRTMFADIALVKIKGKFWEHGPTEAIAPLKIPMKPARPGSTCVVSGFGMTTNAEKKGSRLLRYYVGQVMSIYACSQEMRMMLYGMLCLEAYDRISCKGDSGGPAMQSGYLMGIVSWGFDTCVQPEYPDIYTNVYLYRHWILYNRTNRIVPNIPMIIVNLSLFIYYFLI